jgi:hypothetical protein
MWPRYHKNGSVAGSPVTGFGVLLVYDQPVIWPRWFWEFSTVSAPPSVPNQVELVEAGVVTVAGCWRMTGA